MCAKVLRHLTDVHSIVYGDFLGCGATLALFLRCASHSSAADSAEDILSVVDAEMEAAQSIGGASFGQQFLLTDFSQVGIDRWNPTTTVCFS